MNIEEIKELKAECEQKILHILNDLKNKTDCMIDDIGIEYIVAEVVGSGESTQVINKINIDLKI